MTDSTPRDNRELVLSLNLAAPRAAIWRCWTEPDLLEQWFTPSPWRTTDAHLDVRPGGVKSLVMRGPEGEIVTNPGVYLEVVPGRKLVFTDAFSEPWEPSEKAFTVTTVEFEDDGSGGTNYRARATHWSAADCRAHSKMGFHDGWTRAARQLEALARTIR